MRRPTVDAWLVTAILVSALPVRLAAQAPTSNTDGVIAPAIAPGNPASSYALSGLDHVNEYNGNLNVKIPLYQVGGRGTAGYTMLLPMDQGWGVQQNNGYSPFDWRGTPDINPPSYSPGYLYVRHDSGQPNACYDDIGNSGWYDVGPYVTRVMWVAPDGTVTTLLDGAYGGQEQDPPAGNGSDCPHFYNVQVANRGQVFKSADGSGLTFVADQSISDRKTFGDDSQSGTLYFRDGTSYRIGSWGEVDMIEDRNGNQVQLTYGRDNSGNETLLVVDPLNRRINVVMTASQDVITYPGANGSQHSITVNYTALQDILGGGQAMETYQCLFPELDGSTQNLL